MSIGATALQKPGVLEVLVSGGAAVAGAGCSAPGSPAILQCTVSGGGRADRSTVIANPRRA